MIHAEKTAMSALFIQIEIFIIVMFLNSAAVSKNHYVLRPLSLNFTAYNSEIEAVQKIF